MSPPGEHSVPIECHPDAATGTERWVANLTDLWPLLGVKKFSRYVFLQLRRIPARRFSKRTKEGSTGASDSPAPPEVGYRDFGVTSSFVVEASGFDELPGPGCAFFSCVSSDAFCFWPCVSSQPLVRSSYHPSETRTGFRGGALVYSFHERTFRKLVRTIYSRDMTHMDAEQKRA